jgi:RNA polymerase sigma-70 factor (ECF subfamily)
VDGAPGIVFVPRGRVSIALVFTIAGGRIVEIDVVADPERLSRLDLATLDGPGGASCPYE